MPEFGTSGLRGLAVDLTDELVARYAAAFVSLHDHNGTVFVGQDRRESSPRIVNAVARGAAGEGVRVIDCGVLPTPAMAGAAMEAGTLSIMVTGSHIPGDRNGLKFYTAHGEFTKADEAPLAAAFAARIAPDDGDIQIEENTAAREAYVRRYIDGFPIGVLAGLRVGVWVHSSAASVVLPQVLNALGADVVELGVSDDFVPVDTEAVESDARAQLKSWVTELGLAAIVSTDGDADRPLLIDDQGQQVPGDILGPITARWCGASRIVTTVSANSLVDQMGDFAGVTRTKIGSPYVIADMEALFATGGQVVGYEPNGGFLLGRDLSQDGRRLSKLMTRDAFLPILATLAASNDAGSISAMVDALPARRTAADRLKDIPREVSQKIVEHILGGDLSILPSELGAVVSTDTTDGVRLTFSDDQVVHIRPSGNAPELRCYIEADSDLAAQTLLQAVLARLKLAAIAE